MPVLPTNGWRPKITIFSRKVCHVQYEYLPGCCWSSDSSVVFYQIYGNSYPDPSPIVVSNDSTRAFRRFSYPAEVMPHQVLQDTLGHPLGPEVAYVQLLVAPLDPSRLRRDAVYQAQSVNLLRMRQRETGQDVRASTNPEADDGLETEVS